LALKKDEVKKDAELENIKNIIMLYMNAKKWYNSQKNIRILAEFQ
jgi:hypothetical protein